MGTQHEREVDTAACEALHFFRQLRPGRGQEVDIFIRTHGPTELSLLSRIHTSAVNGEDLQLEEFGVLDRNVAECPGRPGDGDPFSWVGFHRRDGRVRRYAGTQDGARHQWAERFGNWVQLVSREDDVFCRGNSVIQSPLRWLVRVWDLSQVIIHTLISPVSPHARDNLAGTKVLSVCHARITPTTHPRPPGDANSLADLP